MSTTIRLERTQAQIEKEETPDIFRSRIRYIETCLAELVQEAGKHHAELMTRIEFASGSEAQRAAMMAEKITQVQKDIQELELLIYGEPKYLMPGLAKQIQQIDEALTAMTVEREALKNQIKGISIGWKLAGGGTLVTFGAVLWEIFK